MRRSAPCICDLGGVPRTGSTVSGACLNVSADGGGNLEIFAAYGRVGSSAVAKGGALAGYAECTG